MLDKRACSRGRAGVASLQVGPRPACCTTLPVFFHMPANRRALMSSSTRKYMTVQKSELFFIICHLRRRLTRLLDRALTALARRFVGAFEAPGSALRLNISFWQGEPAGY